MPYKRSAHVLFVSSGEACRALLATYFANTIGATWIEGRAVPLQHLGVSSAPACELVEGEALNQPLYDLDQANIAWADLIVTLDESAKLACHACPVRVQQRCYPVAEPKNAADLKRVREEILRRVEGMIGGMRMMQQIE